MKKTICLLTILFSSLINAQSNSGYITYKLIINKTENQKQSSRINSLLDIAEASAKNIELTLQFNKNKSVFSLNKNMYDDDTKLAIAFCNCSKTTYTDLDKDEYSFIPENRYFKKNEFIVKDKIKNNWTITNETKNIENFKCIKATQNIKVTNDKGEFYRTIIAWFCPELPYHFGPKEFSGLPGLILELQEKNNLFGVKKIVISKDNQDITFPYNNKVVDYDTYEKMLKQNATDIMNSKQNIER